MAKWLNGLTILTIQPFSHLKPLNQHHGIALEIRGG